MSAPFDTLQLARGFEAAGFPLEMEAKITEDPFLADLAKLTKLIDPDGKIKAEMRRLEALGPIGPSNLKSMLFFPCQWANYWCPRLKIWQDARLLPDNQQIQIRHMLSVYWKWKFHPLFPLSDWH
jgi:hypothetical protein